MSLESVKLPASGHWMLPKPFDGAAGSSLDAFLRDFFDCLDVNGFVQVGLAETVDAASRRSMTRMALFILKRSLKGSAAQMLESLSETARGEVEEIVDALKSRFGDKDRLAVRQAELFSRKRLPGETPAELGDAIAILASKAFPGAPDSTIDSLGVRTFIAALSPSLGQRVGDFEPETIVEAARKAMVLESRDVGFEQSGGLQVAQRVETTQAAQSSVLDALVQLGAAQTATTALLEKLVARLEDPDKAKRPKFSTGGWRSAIQCFHCQQKGHIKRECPALNKQG